MGDSNQTLVAGGVGTAFTMALLVFYKFILPLFNATNHKRVRSVCCGKTCVSSIDVEETTPKSGVAESGVENPAAQPQPAHAKLTIG